MTAFFACRDGRFGLPVLPRHSYVHVYRRYIAERRKRVSDEPAGMTASDFLSSRGTHTSVYIDRYGRSRTSMYFATLGHPVHRRGAQGEGETS